MTACTVLHWLPAADGASDCLHFDVLNAGYPLPELEFSSLVTWLGAN